MPYVIVRRPNSTPMEAHHVQPPTGGTATTAAMLSQFAGSFPAGTKFHVVDDSAVTTYVVETSLVAQYPDGLTPLLRRA